MKKLTMVATAVFPVFADAPLGSPSYRHLVLDRCEEAGDPRVGYERSLE